MEPTSGHTDLYRALVRGREAVELYRHIEAELGHSWEEEPATIQLLQACTPEAQFTRFNKYEEGKLGADWMWWWQGSSGECFGMLVQAKRIHRNGGSWSFDFRHPGTSNEQRKKLFAACDALNLAAIYALYCGDGAHRQGFGCKQPADHEDACPSCRASAVSVVSGILVDSAVTLSHFNYPGHSAEDALRYAIPLQDLADPSTCGPVLSPVEPPPEIVELLALPQAEARHIAKAILAMVIDWRGLQFGDVRATTMERARQADPVFTEYPVDYGSHGFQHYFQLVLGGLRTGLPSYVEEGLASGERPAEVPDNVAGITLFQFDT